MAKIGDRDRVLRLLGTSDGLSNLHVKTELDLSDDRYQIIRDELLEDGLIQKYVCRGGGIRLTHKGERELPDAEEATSTVPRERDLYQHLVDFLTRQADEDTAGAIICDTSRLRSRGQWQNPDITHISIEHYPYLDTSRIIVSTYEVKAFAKWDTGVAYQAASHNRFSHLSYAVLEWPTDLGDLSLTDPTYKVDQIARECGRFGIGLATLRPYYNSYRLHVEIEAEPKSPADEDVEHWLSRVFENDQDAQRDFMRLREQINGQVV